MSGEALRKPSDFQWFTTLYPSGDIRTIAICSNCVESFTISETTSEWRSHQCKRVIIAAPMRKAEP
jgi:hypothetical protein